jgi:hypothetical protein
MVETHDPAGWYPDPTGNHELRYWDGFAWLDNVSDQGATTTDPLGGKPQPPPSQAAARSQATPVAAPPARSKMPIIIGAVVAAIVIIAAAAFFLTRGGDDDSATVLKDKPVTFTDDGKDETRPTVHAVKVDANHAVIITVKGDDDSLTPGIIVEADQSVVDAVNSQISDASDVLGGEKLRDACSNLREEDIGAKGNVAYFFDSAVDAGSELKSFAIMPAAGDFEFVPVLIDDKGDCQAGKLTMTLTAIPLDFGDVSNLSDLESVLSDDSNLSDFLSS